VGTSAFPAGYTRASFSADVPGWPRLTREVLRRPGAGPAVILMHEAPGLSASTIAIADLLASHGYRMVLPILIGRPRLKGSMMAMASGMLRLCIAREFGAWARNESSPIVDWLTALAENEHARCGGPGVGAIGMCFSGGFALAMARNSHVAAAVASQPALPFPIPGRAVDFGVSDTDVEAITARGVGGFRVRTIRFQRDFKSPGRRQREICARLPVGDEHAEVPTWNPNRHSVLGEAMDALPGDGLATVLADTLAYLFRQLPPGPVVAAGLTGALDAPTGG